ARMINEREELWRKRHPKWRCSLRFADPQAAAARKDLRQDHGLQTHFYATRDVKEQIKLVVDLVRDMEFFVDAQRCPFFCDEIESWHYPKKRMGMTDD